MSLVRPICRLPLGPSGAFPSARLFRPHSRRRALALMVGLALGMAACGGGPETRGGDGWQHSRTSEGDVTTVRTTAGSKWGAPVHLQEEVSIGVAAGDNPYMFGQVSSVWATEEAIFVADSGGHAVRVYNHKGEWLRDLGSVGQGPGEYEMPTQVLVTGDGRTVVADMTGRTNVYDAGGAPLATWNPSARGAVRLSTGNMLLLRDDDSLWTRSSAMPSEQEMRQGGVLRIREGMAPIGEDGTPGEIIEPPSVDGKGAGMEMRAAGAGGGIRVSVSSGAAAPFTPALAWTMAANGDWVVGTAESYRFEIHHEAGGKTIVERYWEPVPVLLEEANYFISRVETMRQRADPSYRYDGPPVPTAKPAYAQLQVDRSGRIWVQRQGLGYRIPGCEDDGGQQSVTSAGGRTMVMTTAATPCWGAAVILDVFDASGDYLGEVIAPEGLRFGAIYIEDDLFLAAAEDDDGLVMVKKYRIAPAADSNP